MKSRPSLTKDGMGEAGLCCSLGGKHQWPTNAHNKLQCRLLLGRVGVEHDPDFPEELTIGL
jgi:hypothetical protein